VIIPGQRRMVAAMREGRRPDPMEGRRGKQRSVHNNYFTLPVVFTMVSNHYASTYGHAYNWAVLALIAGAGVAIRHFFNRRHKGVLAWRYLGIGAVLLGATTWWTMPRVPELPEVEGEVTFDRVRAIVGERCLACHTPAPTFPGILQPGAGVLLHTPDGLTRNAERIYQQVVATRIMPLGNATAMTDQERAVIASWVRNGAHER
ncbi:MAG TPA: urate hydroxylase PuuD, partial [Opitutus sp.]|nr:urate hydroxylase PuuD [Opitutus sp.]